MSKKMIFWSVIIFIILASLWILISQQIGPGKLDVFAQCLKDKGASFYGAFWCPYCQKQKAMFGKSERLLPYVECSTPDGKSQLPTCAQNGVKSYPTWIFADGSRETGSIPLQTLAEKTGCSLPQ